MAAVEHVLAVVGQAFVDAGLGEQESLVVAVRVGAEGQEIGDVDALGAIQVVGLAVAGVDAVFRVVVALEGVNRAPMGKVAQAVEMVEVVKVVEVVEKAEKAHHLLVVRRGLDRMTLLILKASRSAVQPSLKL